MDTLCESSELEDDSVEQVGSMKSRETNVRIIVCPKSEGGASMIPAHFLEPDVRYVDFNEVFSSLQRSRIARRMINICGRVGVGKSVVATVIQRVWPEFCLLPEAKDEQKRPLRPKEKVGRDIILYRDQEAFWSAISEGHFVLAYHFRRSTTSTWEMAGLPLYQLERIAEDKESRYLTVLNGMAWTTLREALPFLQGFVVLNANADYERLKQRRGIPSTDGLEMDYFGVINAGRDVPAVTKLPNPFLSHGDPYEVIERRFRHPEVREYLERVLFWGDRFPRDEELAELDIEHVMGVLWGHYDDELS